MDTRRTAQLYENHFFHNRVSCNNIQGTVSSLVREREWQCSVSGACVVAVAALDGCVCQGGRPCSLMMAMPAHKPSPADVCVSTCACVCVCDFSGWMKCVRGSDS